MEKIMKRDTLSKRRTNSTKRQAKASLKRLHALLAGRPSPFAGLTAQEAVERIRKVREALWEEKFAPRA